MSVFIGIDVSKASLDLASYPQGASITLPNQPKAFAELHTWLKAQGPVSQIALEATGRYGEAMAQFLLAQGYALSYLNPRQVHNYSKSKLHYHKTDRQDAALIARFCALEQPPLWQAPSALRQVLQQRSRRLDALKAMRQQEVNRLASGLTDAFVLEQIKTSIAHFDRLIAQTQAALDALIQASPPLKVQETLLCSIRGIGKTTAQLLLAEIEIQNFASARDLAVFVGITPLQHQSGSSIKKRSQISKQGNARLRAGLYLPAVVAKRYNPACRDLAQRLESRHKAGKVIVVALMRKLLHQVYGILKSGQPFDPNFETAS
jgi:transposase